MAEPADSKSTPRVRSSPNRTGRCRKLPSAVVLLGAGGHASDVLAVIEALVECGESPPRLTIADEDWRGKARRFVGRLDYEQCDDFAEIVDRGNFIVSIGYPKPRAAIAELATSLGASPLDQLVHPNACIGALADWGVGTVINGGAWISPNVGLGSHCYVAYGATIGHETRIGDYTSVMPGASISGDVQIGAGVLVGTNSTVLQGLAIGDGASIGAGAVVTSDVAAGITVVGTPAKPLR